MEKSLKALVDILQKLNALYMEIEHIEVQKTTVIMKRDGAALQSMAEEQEKTISEIDEAEENRRDIISMIARGLGISEGDITISGLAGYMDDEIKEALRKASADLTKVMGRVKRLNELNNKCLTDNIDFFNQILDSLRESVALDEGYSNSTAVKRQTTSSALFNRTV